MFHPAAHNVTRSHPIDFRRLIFAYKRRKQQAEKCIVSPIRDTPVSAARHQPQSATVPRALIPYIRARVTKAHDGAQYSAYASQSCAPGRVTTAPRVSHMRTCTRRTSAIMRTNKLGSFLGTINAGNMRQASLFCPSTRDTRHNCPPARMPGTGMLGTRPAYLPCCPHANQKLWARGRRSSAPTV